MGVSCSSALWSPPLQARSSRLMSPAEVSDCAALAIGNGPNYTAVILSRRIRRLSEWRQHMKPILISIAAGSLLAALAIAQTPRYTVIDLGTLPGGTSSMANYLNDNRLIAGNAANAGGTQQAIFWWG